MALGGGDAELKNSIPPNRAQWDFYGAKRRKNSTAM